MQADSSMWTAVLTPRQDRLESALARGLWRGAPRSELRETVYQLVDLYRLQGIPAVRGIHAIMDTATRALRVGLPRSDGADDSSSEYLQLLESWAARRYARDD